MHAPSPPQQNRILGIGLRVGAASSFALMAALIKLGYAAGVGTVELVFYRLFFGLPPVLAWIAWSGRFDAWRTRAPLAHLGRAALGLTTMALGFAALGYLPLAEATTINFAAPLFAVALSALVLRERVGRYRWSAVAAGFVGVLIVMQPAGSQLPAIGLALALAAAFGSACVIITLRQIGRTEGTQTIVLWFTLAGTIVVGAAMPSHFENHNAATWTLLVAMGLLGGIGQLFMTGSLRFATVATVVPFDYTQLLWAVALGWLMFAVQPSATTWIGAAVIVASGLYTVYREHRLGVLERKRAAEAVES